MPLTVTNNPYNKRVLINSTNFLEPFPVGFTVPWVGTTPPEKGFFIKGQLVQRDEAPELYEFALNNNLIKSEEEWQEQKLYGFYSDGDCQTTFRLPLYTGYKFIGYDETQHILGKPLEPAVPNITGTFFSSDDNVGRPEMVTGAFSAKRDVLNANTTGGSFQEAVMSFAASKVSPVYRDGVNTVQTPDIPENWIIKYKS